MFRHKITEPSAQIPTGPKGIKKKRGKNEKKSQNNRAFRSNPNWLLQIMMMVVI